MLHQKPRVQATHMPASLFAAREPKEGAALVPKGKALNRLKSVPDKRGVGTPLEALEHGVLGHLIELFA